MVIFYFMQRISYGQLYISQTLGKGIGMGTDDPEIPAGVSQTGCSLPQTGTLHIPAEWPLCSAVR